MDFSQYIHDLQPYMQRSIWVMPAVAAYMALRSAWGARKASPFIRRAVSGIVLAILLSLPLYASTTMALWVAIFDVGLALAAVGLTRQAIYTSSAVVPRIAKTTLRGMAGVGGTAAIVSLLGIASGNALVFSLGPSMWPTAAISPSIEWLNTKAYRLSPPMVGDDIEFTVDWTTGQEYRDRGDGWPTGRYRKRVWGVPGDVVQIHPDKVVVNNRVVMDCSDSSRRTWTSNGKTWQAQAGAWFCFPDFDGDGQADETMPLVWGALNQYMYAGNTYKVGDGELFVMGDNTLQSSDSRELGVIKRAWVDGKHSQSKEPKGAVINNYR